MGVELGLRRPAPRGGRSAAPPSGETPAFTASDELLRAVHAASTFVSRVRSHGHLAARLDPLGSEPEGDPGAGSGERRAHARDLRAKLPANIFGVYVAGATLADALPYLLDTYCGTIAYEIEHIASHRQRVWLREHIESGAYRTS